MSAVDQISMLTEIIELLMDNIYSKASAVPYTLLSTFNEIVVSISEKQVFSSF